MTTSLLSQSCNGERIGRSALFRSGFAVATAALILFPVANLSGQVVQRVLKPAARDSVNDVKLREEIAAAATLNDRMKTKSKPLEGERPNTGSTLYARSLILFDGEKHTVVPVGSVLHLPEALQDRVIAEPVGDFTFWPRFLEANAAWLGAREVPLKMAKGDVESAKAVLRSIAKEPRLLVAVFNGGPISILEPTAPAPSTAGANASRP